MNEKMKKKLEESYNHIKPYLKDQEILRDLCSWCERYNGRKHDYEECLDMPCFKCYLGYEYLRWQTSWE